MDCILFGQLDELAMEVLDDFVHNPRFGIGGYADLWDTGHVVLKSGTVRLVDCSWLRRVVGTQETKIPAECTTILIIEIERWSVPRRDQTSVAFIQSKRTMFTQHWFVQIVHDEYSRKVLYLLFPKSYNDVSISWSRVPWLSAHQWTFPSRIFTSIDMGRTPLTHTSLTSDSRILA